MSVTLLGSLVCPDPTLLSSGLHYVVGEVLIGTGTLHPLAFPPLDASAVFPYLNGAKLDPDAQFSISGQSLVTNRSVTAADRFLVDYITRISDNRPLSETVTSTGTSHVLAFAPDTAENVMVVINGSLMEKVGSSPSRSEYVLIGNALTTGQLIAPLDSFVVIYIPSVISLPSQSVILREALSTTGTSHALAMAPNSVGEVGLFLNGDRMEKKDTPVSNWHYSILASGAITTFRSIVASDDFVASYIS